MQKLRDRHINIDKAATMSIVINCVEVVLLVALLVADMFDLSEELLRIVRPFSTVALVVLIVEGLTSVRDGFVWKKTNQQNEMLREAFDQLDDLNTQMRKQRHDFLNHLQVVYSLVDMGENAEATKYIETVYGQMHRLSAGMKTDKPAINALLQAKLGDAERRGVRMELDVTSRYAGLPMNDWEMCRVLGNLIDNAMDAMEGMEGGRLVVELYDCLLYTSRERLQVPLGQRLRADGRERGVRRRVVRLGIAPGIPEVGEAPVQHEPARRQVRNGPGLRQEGELARHGLVR